MPTIRDVARQSGVSIATVSHVLNNRCTKVGSGTRDRVLAAVRELKYRPTAFEENQKAVATKNLGFIVGDLGSNGVANNGYLASIMNSAIEVAAHRGYNTTVMVERVWDDVGLAVRKSYDGHCDGVMLLAPMEGSEIVSTMWERGVPIVAIGSTLTLPGTSSVDIDNQAAFARSTRYLIELGHRNIAYVGAGRNVVSSGERAEGYIRAMAEAGLEPENVRVVFTRFASSTQFRHRHLIEAELAPPPTFFERFQEANGWSDEAVVQYLLSPEGLPNVTAIVCWNDDLAQAVTQALLAHGLRVPDDVSVVGCDDWPFSTSPVPLTTFVQPFKEIGKTAVELLLDRIDDNTIPNRQVKFEPEFVIRESTRSPRPV